MASIPRNAQVIPDAAYQAQFLEQFRTFQDQLLEEVSTLVDVEANGTSLSYNEGARHRGIFQTLTTQLEIYQLQANDFPAFSHIFQDAITDISEQMNAIGSALDTITILPPSDEEDRITKAATFALSQEQSLLEKAKALQSDVAKLQQNINKGNIDDLASLNIGGGNTLIDQYRDESDLLTYQIDALDEDLKTQEESKDELDAARVDNKYESDIKLVKNTRTVLKEVQVLLLEIGLWYNTKLKELDKKPLPERVESLAAAVEDLNSTITEEYSECLPQQGMLDELLVEIKQLRAKAAKLEPEVKNQPLPALRNLSNPEESDSSTTNDERTLPEKLASLSEEIEKINSSISKDYSKTLPQVEVLDRMLTDLARLKATASKLNIQAANQFIYQRSFNQKIELLNKLENWAKDTANKLQTALPTRFNEIVEILAKLENWGKATADKLLVEQQRQKQQKIDRARQEELQKTEREHRDTIEQARQEELQMTERAHREAKERAANTPSTLQHNLIVALTLKGPKEVNDALLSLSKLYPKIEGRIYYHLYKIHEEAQQIKTKHRDYGKVVFQGDSSLSKEPTRLQSDRVEAVRRALKELP